MAATDWAQALADIAAAVAQAKGVAAPVAGGTANAEAQAIAQALLAGERKAVCWATLLRTMRQAAQSAGFGPVDWRANRCHSGLSDRSRQHRRCPVGAAPSRKTVA